MHKGRCGSGINDVHNDRVAPLKRHMRCAINTIFVPHKGGQTFELEMIRGFLATKPKATHEADAISGVVSAAIVAYRVSA